MKKCRTALLLLSAISLFTALGCEKEGKLCCPHPARGMVLYYGNPAVDGCGWLIKVNDALYSPITLDNKFKQDSLQVVLDYQVLTSTLNCGWRKPGYPQIRINHVNKL